jgi:polyhydroxyalkanoate synthase
VPSSNLDSALERRLDAAVAHFSAFAESWLTAVESFGPTPAGSTERARYIEELVATLGQSRGVRDIGFPHALVLDPLISALAQRAIVPLVSWFQALAAAPPASQGGTKPLAELLTAIGQIDCNEAGRILAEAQSELMAALADYVDATTRCEDHTASVITSACTRFRAHLLQQSHDPAWQPGDVRKAYRGWLECFDASYGELLRDDTYAAAFGARLNAASAIALAVRQWAAVFPGTQVNAQENATATRTAADMDSALSGRRPSPRDVRPACDLATREVARFQELAAVRYRRLRSSPSPETSGCARELVWSKHGICLYHYPGNKTQASQGTSLLIVYAMVNRPGMLDLQTDRSLVRGLTERGVDLFLLDWGDPGTARERCDLADHVLVHLDTCVEQVHRLSGQTKVNLLGVCQGGVLALCYAALRPHKIARLVTMVTPVDFHAEENTLGRLARFVDFGRLVRAAGNVPGGLLNALFLSLSPVRLGIRKYFDLIDRPRPSDALADFMRMESWIFDSPDQPGLAFAEFARQLIHQNGLVEGSVKLGDERVDLGRIQCPVLNVYATEDHLVPPASAKALQTLLSHTQYQEYGFAGGHIGIYVSRRAQGRVAETLVTWLRGDRTPQVGSAPSRS